MNQEPRTNGIWVFQEHLQSPFNFPGKSPLSKQTLSDSAAAAEEKTKQEIWATL